MKEQTFNRSFGTPARSEQPSFDDERTLLSARRVVPLERIDAKERRRRRWLLGGAFALAMMLGAASALVASYLKLRNVPSATITTIETQAAPVVAASEPPVDELPVVENTEAVEDAEEPPVPVTPKRAPAVKRQAPVNLNTDLVRPRVVRETEEEEDELQRIREAVLIDAWQERRARRAARRERRNRVDHHDRDLSNLDEIFEGRRRRP